MGTCSELLSTIMWSWSFIRLGLFLSKNGTAIIHSTPQSSAGNAVKRTCNLPQIKNIFSIHIMITKGNQVLQSFPFSRWTNEIWQVTSAFTSAHTAGEGITQNRNTTWNCLLFPLLLWWNDKGACSTHRHGKRVPYSWIPVVDFFAELSRV